MDAKYAKYGQICIFGAYLGAPNMVKWGVPEKILQNADRQNGVLSEYIMTKCKGRNMISRAYEPDEYELSACQSV